MAFKLDTIDFYKNDTIDTFVVRKIRIKAKLHPAARVKLYLHHIGT